MCVARVAGLLAIALVFGCAESEGSGPVRVITSVARSFDAADSQGEVRTLPDAWSAGERASHDRAFYTALIDLDAVPDVPWSVYLARVDTNARVWLNGTSLGGVGRLEHRRPACAIDRSSSRSIPSCSGAAETN